MSDIRDDRINNLKLTGTISGGGVQALARTPAVQMTAAASGSSGIQVLDDADIDFGTGDFTIHWEGALPDWTPNSEAQDLVNKRVSSVGYRLVIGSTALGFPIVFVNATQYTASIANTIADGASAKITAVVNRETAATAGSVVFYINGTAHGAPVTITAGAPATVSNAADAYISGTSTSRFASTTRACYLFNRALTAAEVLDLSINGPALADRGASQAQRITNGGFDTDLASWSIGANISAAYDAGEASLSLTGAITASAGNWFFQASVMPDRFKRYLIEFDATYVSGAGLHIGAGFRRFASVSSAQNAGVKQRYVYSIIPENETSTSTTLSNIDRLVFASSSSGAASWKIDNVSVKQIGITGMWDARDAQWDAGQIFDTSGNKNHGMLPATGATVLPRKTRFEVRGTNTWTGTQELQYIGGVNQAILPANAFIETIAVKVTGTDIHDVFVGDGADVDRYVVISGGGGGHGGVAMTVGSYYLPIANHATDGTNLKLTVDPDTDCTMTIAWVITYYTME
jgi:hypothetical protein